MLGLSLSLSLGSAHQSGGTPTPTPAPTWSIPPSIDGVLRVGQTITLNDGTFDGDFVSRQLRADGVAIDGATEATYELTEAELDANLSVRVYASNAGGTAFATSETVGPVLAAAGPGDLIQPLAVVDHDEKTITLDMVPQDGVTYAVWQMNADASETSLGALNSGNGYSISIDGTGGLDVFIRATLDTETADSDHYALINQNVVKLWDFNTADGPLEGYDGFTRVSGSTAGALSIKDNRLVNTQKAAANAYNADIGVQKFGFRYRARPANGTSYTSDQRDYGNFRFWVGTGLPHYDFTYTAGYFVLLGVGSGTNAETSGNVNWRTPRTINELIEVRPIHDGASTYLQVFKDGVPQYSANSYKGLLLTSVGSTGTWLRPTSRAATSADVPPFNWQMLDDLAVLDYSASPFTITSQALAAPTMEKAATVTIDGFYDGTISNVSAAIFNSLGRQIADWTSFETSGGGVLGSHEIELPESAYGSGGARIILRNDDDHAEWSEVLLGNIPVYAAMPTNQVVGQNFPVRQAAVWENYGFISAANYLDAGNLVVRDANSNPYPVDLLPSGKYTGLITPEAYAAGARKIGWPSSSANMSGQSAAGTYDVFFRNDVDPDYFPLSVTNVLNGASNASIGASGGTIDFASEQVLGYLFIVTPQAGSEDHLPEGGLDFCIYRQGTDQTRLLIPEYMPANYGAASGFKLTRPMQLLGNTGPRTMIDEFPFVANLGQYEPSFLSQLGAEMGLDWLHVPFPALDTDARHDQFDMEFLHRLAAYEADAGVAPERKFTGKWLREETNERWNLYPDYASNWQHLVGCAGEKGLFSTFTGTVIADWSNEIWMNKTRFLGADLDNGQRVFGLAKPTGGSDNLWFVLEAIGDVTAGEAMPPSDAIGTLNANGNLIVRANLETISVAVRDYAFYRVGRSRDIWRTGIVPGNPGLSDPSVAMGAERVFSYAATGVPENATQIKDSLKKNVDGIEGGETFRSVDYIGPTHYFGLKYDFRSNPTPGGWVALMATDPAAAATSFFATMADKRAAQITVLRNQLHGTVQGLVADGFSYDEVKHIKGATYEGGSDPDIWPYDLAMGDAILDFLWTYIFNDERWSNESGQMILDTLNIGYEIATEFIAYGPFQTSASLVKNEQLMRFGVELLPGWHNDPARALLDRRYQGIAAAAATVAGL